MLSIQVFCSLQIAGIHNWPDCPYEEVDYLRVPHRHMFHIEAYKNVTHDDRDVEFIILKRQIQQYLVQKYGIENDTTLMFGPMSCEMIARELISEFGLSACSVSEDGENGAMLTEV